jgi:hypothetical protein
LWRRPDADGNGHLDRLTDADEHCDSDGDRDVNSDGKPESRSGFYVCYKPV